MRLRPRWILPLTLTSVLLGQESTARQLQLTRATLAPGSAEWFENGFDLVEAQMKCDIAAAVRTATELHRAAQASALPDVDGIAYAMAAMARCSFQGPRMQLLAPAALATDEPRPTRDLSATAGARSRARYFTARARSGGYADVPAEFLPDMFTALEAARASGDPAMLHRAGWTLHGVLERQAPAYDAELLRELAATADTPAAAPFAAWRALQEYWLASSNHTRAERLQQLDGLSRIATELGDLRTLVHVEWDRVAVTMAGEDRDEAAAILVRMLPLAERLADAWMLGVTLELAAEIALERQRLDEAAAFLARAGKVAGNRGYPDREVQQAHLRLQLANARNDDAAAAAETARLEELRDDDSARYRGFAALLEQLLVGERQHLDLARDLDRERERSARTMRTALIGGLGLLVLALATLALLALRSRRRLQRAHADLQAEVRRSEQEVAARRTLEQRLRQIERTESLGIVAGGIAHDFNNLMVAVLGNADLLRTDEPDPQRRRRLEAIAAAGERGAKLCGQLQAYAGNQSVRTESFDVVAMVRGMAPVLEAAAGPSLQLSIAGDDSPLRLDGNATQLEQALLNLLTNARDAKATRVRITVSREQRSDGDFRGGQVRGETAGGTFACITVEDDGEGMSAAVQERIFDPFFTTRFPGRGLGLAVVFGALRHHRGTITVDSAPGRGSCFRLFLPLLAATDSAPPAPVDPVAAPAAAPRAIAPMTVLVIDDEVHVRDLVTSSLTRRGHRVIGIGDGRDLVAAMPGLDRAERAIALVDLSMPGFDGRDVVRRLRELHPGLPIALMSGHSLASLTEIARELDVAGCIGKPFRAAELERTLDEVLTARSAAARRGA
ncbi:MAG: ATP-binding protein [Planctomycetes bacterium]|jgi:signal transduction histidine kinase/ActR/RegA family two-component response regulator|nr:ATP-binding protein [Planctomycetota bacterium]